MASGTRSKNMLNAEIQEKQQKLYDVLANSEDEIKSLSKDELVKIVLSMKDHISLLNSVSDFMERSNKRMDELERQQNLNAQYIRRSCIEISGIPPNVEKMNKTFSEEENLETEVLKIYNAAGVVVHGNNVKREDIEAVHRVGKKNITIVKFVNRKFAYAGLFKGRNLKDNSPYDNAVFINHSQCREFKFLNWKIREAKKAKKLFKYRVRHGVNQVQFKDGDDWLKVSHKTDLINFGIDIE